MKIIDINIRKKPETRLEYKLKTAIKRLQIANENMLQQKYHCVFGEKIDEYIKTTTRNDCQQY